MCFGTKAGSANGTTGFIRVLEITSVNRRMDQVAFLPNRDGGA